MDAAIATWGSGATVEAWDPAQVTPANTRLMAMLERTGATPLAAKAHFEYAGKLDISDVLKSVRVPTRVMYMPTGAFPEAAVRHVAELLPRGTFQALPPTKRGESSGKAYIPFFDVVEEVATGLAPSADAGRFLGTVLFTDVVSSTELLADVGDASYRELRSDHERLVRLAVETGGGRLVKVLGDGTMSVFDSPSKAVRCAERVSREAEEAGIVVRCGVHSGEIERDGIDITGLTVHIGARVQSAASPGEILVSRTVHDLTAGSGLTFMSRGEHDLKGIPGRWELFALSRAASQAASLPVEESIETPIDRLAIHTARRAPQVLRVAARLSNAIERRRTR
jgi:class 3 adenylate cyclase